MEQLEKTIHVGKLVRAIAALKELETTSLRSGRNEVVELREALERHLSDVLKEYGRILQKMRPTDDQELTDESS